MATIHVSGESLDVRFTGSEKVLGLVRDRSFPLSAITAVETISDAMGAVRGLRAPGLGLPGRKVGTWRGRGKTLVAARRGEPAVLVSLQGPGYERLVISTPDAEAVAASLRPALR